MSLFISHGAPTFALEPGPEGAALQAWAQARPKPVAVCVVSPHWMTHGLQVGTTAHPETIHDFGGFGPELEALQYPAPGHPDLAQRALALLAAAGAQPQADAHRGLDHGAWVPLMHLYPDADVPAFQVSLPARIDGRNAFALGRALAPLAEAGVLVIGSGSLTHNLRDLRPPGSPEAPYARAFVEQVTAQLAVRDEAGLQAVWPDAPNARQAHPTPDHWWPLLVALGAAGEGWQAEPIGPGGMRYGTLSMANWAFGASPVRAAGFSR